MQTNSVSVVKLGVHYFDLIDLTNFEITVIQKDSVISIDLGFNQISVDPNLVNRINREIQIDFIYIK